MKLLGLLSDLLLIVGAALIGWAAFLIHTIVGLLFCGGLCTLLGFALASLSAKKEETTK